MLVGGTAFAQLLALIALPVLTRLYGPEAFSTLALYAASLGTVAVIASLRYEIAIPVVEEEHEAASLLMLALLLVLITSILTAAVVATMRVVSSADGAVDVNTLGTYAWLLPMGVLLAGSYSAIQYWNTRKRRFASVARTRVAQGVSGTATQLILGLAAVGTPLGLLLGHMISSGAGVVGLGRMAYRDVSVRARATRLTDLTTVALKYRRYPIYAAPESLANTGGMQFPLMLIAVLVPGPLAGLLFVAKRAMSAPMALIGGSFAQVYLSHAPEHFRQGSLGEFTAETVESLGKVAIGPIVALGLLAPSVFPLIFGAAWSQVGSIVLWLVPWVVMQLLTSPVSMALQVTANQRLALQLQIFGLCLRVGAVACACLWQQNHIVPIYAAAGFLFYSLYFMSICFVTRTPIVRLGKVLMVITPWALPWIAAALLAQLAFSQLGIMVA